MEFDHSHPWNVGVLNHFESWDGPVVMLPGDDTRPIDACGAHPDVIDRVWRELNDALPVDCRAVVQGVPALLHPERGVVMAITHGTAYALRVTDEDLPSALEAGCHLVREWTGGGQTNISDALGHGWVFGHHSDREGDCLCATFDALDAGD